MPDQTEQITRHDVHGGSRRRRRKIAERRQQVGVSPYLAATGAGLLLGSPLGDFIPGSDYIPLIGTKSILSPIYQLFAPKNSGISRGTWLIAGTIGAAGLLYYYSEQQDQQQIDQYKEQADKYATEAAARAGGKLLDVASDQ